MLKSRPYRLKDGKYTDDKGKKHKFKGDQKDLIINLKKHAKYDLSKYNKLKAVEKSIRKVEETDINLKTAIRKNEYKDIKNIEDKIKNDEKLTDEEKLLVGTYSRLVKNLEEAYKKQREVLSNLENKEGEENEHKN